MLALWLGDHLGIAANAEHATVPGWGFLTVRGGIDPKGYRFLPRIVGVVDAWKDF